MTDTKSELAGLALTIVTDFANGGDKTMVSLMVDGEMQHSDVDSPWGQAMVAVLQERDALAARVEDLEGALRAHHQWHLMQDRDGSAWGVDPVDAYSESGLCEMTIAALSDGRA